MDPTLACIGPKRAITNVINGFLGECGQRRDLATTLALQLIFQWLSRAFIIAGRRLGFLMIRNYLLPEPLQMHLQAFQCICLVFRGFRRIATAWADRRRVQETPLFKHHCFFCTQGWARGDMACAPLVRPFGEY